MAVHLCLQLGEIGLELQHCHFGAVIEGHDTEVVRQRAAVHVQVEVCIDQSLVNIQSGYEDNTWMFTVFGMAGNQPPRDLAGMLSFAEEYCPAHLFAAIRAAEPIGDVAHHHMPSSQWRRYDKSPGCRTACWFAATRSAVSIPSMARE